jgi:hypothetical protein
LSGVAIKSPAFRKKVEKKAKEVGSILAFFQPDTKFKTTPAGRIQGLAGVVCF